MFTKFHDLNIFQKSGGPFNLISIFLILNNFCQKMYEKTYHFYGIFSNFLSGCTRSQNIVTQKFSEIKWRLFQNVNELLFISATLSNIRDKTYEKTYHFYNIFSNFFSSQTRSQILLSEILQKENIGSSKMLRNCYSRGPF